MDPDDNQPQDLRQSIESYERLVRARRAREQQRTPASPRPARREPRRWPQWIGLTALGGLALLGGVVMAGPPPEPTLLPSTGLRQTEVWTPPRISATHPELTRIVLDPGHGGHDPGAGAGHLNEAAIVLDVAIRLEAKLREQTGIEVVMTRRDDVYLPLRARTSLANCVGADLFLSIHANASRDQVASGIATYHLRGAAPTTTTTTTAAARIIHAGACRAR